MAKSINRPKVTLACPECKERNYITTKHRVNQRERIELKKYCPRCRQHTAAQGDSLSFAQRRPARTRARHWRALVASRLPGAVTGQQETAWR